MNDIKMGSVWVNRTNGRRVTVSRTATIDGEEQVTITDGERFLSVPITWFDKTFVPVDDPERPYPGEVWTLYGKYTATIITVADGFVVYKIPNVTMACTVEQFMEDGERGDTAPKAVPPMLGEPIKFIYFNIERNEDQGEYTSLVPHTIQPWGTHVRVPLDWNRAERVNK
jgi:hypothetical protein